MKCPSCSTEDSKVVDSRSIQGGESIRRRRECNACNFRYTTYEYVLENPVKVIKKSGEREEYDRAKLEKSFSIACEKRPIPEEKIQTCLIFVALRGGINTGKSESAIDYGKRDVFGTFEEHLQKVLEWKKDPEIFIKELLEQPTQDTLHEAIKEKLESSQ